MESYLLYASFKGLLKFCHGIDIRDGDKDDNLLRDKLNDVLKQMSEDGTMTKLSQKWFNEDITIKVR